MKIHEHSASIGLFWVCLVLIVVFSIFGFWPQCAANLPILSGIVPAEDSCKVMAWQSAFENLGIAPAPVTAKRIKWRSPKGRLDKDSYKYMSGVSIYYI